MTEEGVTAMVTPSFLFSAPHLPVFSGGNGKVDIIFLCTPHQIADMVVLWIVIFMVNNRKTVRVGDKCFSYQPVNEPWLHPVVFVKIDHNMTI